MNKKNILTWGLFFLVFFLLAQQFSKKPAPSSASPIVIEASQREYAADEEVIVKIQNNTDQPITLPAHCPGNPLEVFSWTGEKFEKQVSQTKIDCTLAPKVHILQRKEEQVSYLYWNHSLFGKPGRYKVGVPLSILPESLKSQVGSTSLLSPEFTVVEAGLWRKFFRAILYQPLYNLLVFLVTWAPGRDLGFAIILLTFLIRLILLIPSQRAMKAQRRMQEIQPKLEHIKKKYEGNKERIAQETMALWREHKVNPFGSCLPLLIQAPVLIALYYVIRNGLNPDAVHFLYSPLRSVDLNNVHRNFLGVLDLMRINSFVLPLVIGILQFLQMKLALPKKARQQTTSHWQEMEMKVETPPQSEMEMANKTMVYIMPVMIGLFTASVPAGVGLYWGVSTLFAMGQQWVVNRKLKV